MRPSKRAPLDRRPGARRRTGVMFDRASEYRATLHSVTVNAERGPLCATLYIEGSRRRIETTAQRVIAPPFLHRARTGRNQRSWASPRMLHRTTRYAFSFGILRRRMTLPSRLDRRMTGMRKSAGLSTSLTHAVDTLVRASRSGTGDLNGNY